MIVYSYCIKKWSKRDIGKGVVKIQEFALSSRLNGVCVVIIDIKIIHIKQRRF